MFAGHKIDRRLDPVGWWIVNGLCLVGILWFVGFIVGVF